MDSNCPGTFRFWIASTSVGIPVLSEHGWLVSIQILLCIIFQASRNSHSEMSQGWVKMNLNHYVLACVGGEWLASLVLLAGNML